MLRAHHILVDPPPQVGVWYHPTLCSESYPCTWRLDHAVNATLGYKRKIVPLICLVCKAIVNIFEEYMRNIHKSI